MHMHNGIRYGKNNACSYTIVSSPWHTCKWAMSHSILFCAFLYHTCLTLYASSCLPLLMKNAKKMPALQANPLIHCHRALSFESFSTKFNTPVQKLGVHRTAGSQPQWLKCWLRRSCSNHTWIWSIFTHVLSGYVNLPQQKKVFTQERSSVLSGWDTYMAGVMSCEKGLSLVKLF